MKKPILLLAIFYGALQISNAQPGNLDSSFGKNGIVKADIGARLNYPTTGRQVLSQPNGSMYLVLEANGATVVTKILADGSTDLNFGNKGWSVSVPLQGKQAALQADGKIVVAGEIANPDTYDNYADCGIARLNPDGSLDKAFGLNGITPTRIYGSENVTSIAIQKNGKIVITVNSEGEDSGPDRSYLVRYNTNGRLDNSFGSNGILNILSCQFGGTCEYVSAVAIQDDGKFVIAGTTNPGFFGTPDFIVLRYNTNGSLDTSFSADGKQITDFNGGANKPAAIVIQNDGKIVVGGTALARYNINGSLDSSFDADGKKLIEFTTSSIIVQKDGKIVTTGYASGAGSNDFALTRYNTDGSLDSTFDEDGKTFTDFTSSDDRAVSLVMQENGKLIVLGASSTAAVTRFAAARYNTDGSLDNSFDGDGKLSGGVSQGRTSYKSTAIQSDGKIIAAGYTWNGSNNDFVLVRYNSDGSVDSTFSGDGKQITDFGTTDDYANSIAIQSDGKIVVGGTAGDNFAIARYNADGSRDNTFDGDGLKTTDLGSDDYINSIVFQADGKILAGGSTVVRYNTNGSVDAGFHGDFIICSEIAIQKDGKIVIAGKQPPQIEDGARVVARYNTDGSIDNTFSGDGIIYLFELDSHNAESFLYGESLAIQEDGNIVVGGYFEYDFKGKYSYFALMRFKADGSLDNTFNDGNIVYVPIRNPGNFSLAYATSIKIQVDKKIILAGYSFDGSGNHFTVIRCKTNGILDNTFGNLGIQITNAGGASDEIADIAIADNKLYAAGDGKFPAYMGVVARYSLFYENGTPPEVTLTSPLNAEYLAGGNVYLTAEASDADGTVSKVEFYSGSTLLYTAIDTPYTFKWEHVRTGSYALTAKATDDGGLVTISDPVHISVVPNKPPTVSIIKPANEQTFLSGGTIHLEAAAKDPDGRITKVEFYNDTVLLATERKLPYTFDWAKIKEGNYTITAKATDNWGAITTSAAINVSVIANKLPSVSIINPANGESFTEYSTINLQAAARDPDGRIIKVDFYSGTTLLASERKLPYTYQWKNARAGVYTLTAVAQDNWGAVTTSAPVQVFVVAGSQCPVSSQPTFGFNFNGTNVANVNNAILDSSESASITLCDGGEYTESGRFHSSDFNVYNVTYIRSGGTIFFNGGEVADAVITANQYNAYQGSVTVVLADPNAGGKVGQTITPFTDLNDNGILDEADCAGDPIFINFTITACPDAFCPVSSRPTFGFNFYGNNVANINNGIADSSEAASIAVCAGEEYTTSGHFHSSSSNLYNITDVATGGTLLFSGSADYNRVITAAELTATAGTYTITLADPEVGGTLEQTITPFTDLNGDGTLDDGDCVGDPIVFTYTATPCSTSVCPVSAQPNFGINFNGKPYANINNGILDSSEAFNLTVCNGGQFTASGHLHSSFYTLYNVVVTYNDGALLFNGETASSLVMSASQLSGTAGTYTVTLADPNVAGSIEQTITPFTDMNSNGILDEGDCAGDPIISIITAIPCTGKGNSFVSSKTSANRTGYSDNPVSIKLYPNPAKRTVNMYISGLLKNKPVTLSVISASGVLIKTIKLAGATQNIPIDVSSFISGVYIVKIVSGNKVAYSQFVKL